MKRNNEFQAREHIIEKKEPQVEQFSEVHYRPLQLAKLWGLSVSQIRKMFDNESDVKFLGQTGSTEKRRHRTMLIPASVAQRVYDRLPNLPAVS
jgi:hypothetical protein